jgi:hypothetical protein
MNPVTRWKRGERRGNYAMMMGGLMFIMVGFAAFAVDIGLITMSELQAQATADAASHAALVMFRETHDWGADPGPAIIAGDAAAQWIIDHNDVGLGTATIQSGFPSYGEFDFSTGLFLPGIPVNGGANAVRVAVERTGANSVNLLLAPMLGVSTHDVDAEAVTAQQRRAIMLVQDMSCSMMDGGLGAGNGAIHVSREANRVFLNYLNDRPIDGDMLGIAVFAHHGAAEDGSATQTRTDTPWAQLREIETNFAYLDAKIDGLCSTSPIWCPTGGVMPSPDIGTCTNPGVAMAMATEDLIERTDASTFFRGMVVMSDGVENCTTYAAFDEADTAWTNDVHVWSIVFHNGSFDADYMNAIVRGIGFSQNSPDAADLPIMYEEVAKSLPTTLVD